MIHRFEGFEIDEPQRSLRIRGREVTLQPRVFDLLVYLAKHHTRVVPKEELLEAVWPGVIVTDASLQRAISLGRAALAEAGVADAIRTHARQGYRLCAQPLDPDGRSMGKAPCAALVQAHEAYARAAWGEAVNAFKNVDDVEGLDGDDLQRWAHATQCLGRPDEALPVLERAVVAFGARGDHRRAAWAAILSAHLRVEWGEYPLANGWLQRAARLLEGKPPCREQGYVDLIRGRLALLNNELEELERLAKRAHQAGKQFSDPDLEYLGLVHLGEALLYLGKIREGVAALDEAGVSVVACGLSPWAGGLVYCGVIYSCMTRADWQRASQWTDQFTRWSEGQGGAAYPGLCRMHRAEVLKMRGELGEAESEIEATIEILRANAPWVQGDAWRVLGDIRLARGAYAEAKSAFLRAAELGWESGFGLALVRFAEGEAEAAAQQLIRLIEQNAWSARSQRGLALAYLAIIATAAKQFDRARSALAELDREPDLASAPALRALLSRAQGELLAAEGNLEGALARLRDAIRLYQSVQAPLPIAEVRRLIAALLHRLGDDELARVELGFARSVFEQAGAQGQLQLCADLSAQIG